MKHVMTQIPGSSHHPQAEGVSQSSFFSKICFPLGKKGGAEETMKVL